LYQDAAPGAAAAEFPLADLTLRETGNALRIEAKPFADWGERESIAQNHPALLAIATPAEPYRRKAFNGLAQAIVQSSGERGEIVLRVEGEGLEPASVAIQAEAAR